MAIGTVPVAKPGETDIPLAEKYKLEAAKRMREDGQKQFEDLEFSENERLRGLVDDIWADHNALDALPLPVSENGRAKFLILGAGVGGIVMAVKLIQKGFSAEEMVFSDNAGGVGGTWYWNRYPGLHCDVESYCYLPLLEEMGYMPKHKYSTGVEIRKYLEQLAEKFGLNSRVLFRTQANKLVWDDNEKAWKANVTMRRGPAGRQETSLSFYADHVILANGLFPYAKAPKTPGLAQFAGSLIHTARWNYDITGGSADETFPELSKLKDKVVGIVGTGATAIQVVPQLAKYAKELYVFQRTPSQVFPRNQRATDPEEWRHSIATRPGWQRARAENFAQSVTGELEPEKNLVDDVWTKINSYGAIIGTDRFGMITPDKAPEHIDRMLALDAEHTQKARLRISQTVRNKETAERLKPWYPTWCKRPTFSDEYLDAFNLENVHLVDTNGAGIDSVTPKGVMANTQEYPLDVLILGTGFRVPASKSDPGLRTGVEIVGRHGRRLADKWQQQGISTLHGCVTHGYPNLFIQGAIQAAASPNWNHIVDVQSEHIASIIAMAHSRAGDRKGTVLIEPSVDAEEAWGMIIAQGAAYFAGFSICTPGYLTQEGEAFKMPEPDDHAAMMKKAKEAVWYKGMTDFSRMLEDWRKSGKLEGLEVTVS